MIFLGASAYRRVGTMVPRLIWSIPRIPTRGLCAEVSLCVCEIEPVFVIVAEQERVEVGIRRRSK